MTTHLAAMSLAKGQPYEVRARSTPKPGPDEILIAVKSVALNPADILMRDHGLFIAKYPTVVGFDMSGLVLEVGANVPTGITVDSTVVSFQPGITRVAAYAASFWRSCDPDYGAFQERCLVPWQHAFPIPDDRMSWNEIATLPVAVEVPLNAWDAVGLARVGEARSFPVAGSETREQGNDKREALLIWGASSSVGSMGVQSARLIRDDPSSSFAAVYATAGSTNQDYVTSLGADRVFDYRSAHVVDDIISAARDGGLVIRHCFLAIGPLESCQAILKAFLGTDREDGKARISKIASAPLVPANADTIDGIETIFLMPSAVEKERMDHFRYIGQWLRDKLEKGIIQPSPKPRVVGKGLGAINSGLDLLLGGVSCEKLIVEVAE